LLAIEHAATVAALIMLKTKEVRAAEHRIRGGFLDRLLTATSEDLAVIERDAARFGLDASRPHQIILIHAEAAPTVIHSDLPYRLEYLMQQQGQSGLVAQRGDRILVLCEADDIRTNEVLARRLVDELCRLGVAAWVGLGRPCASLADLSQSHRQADDAVCIGRALFPQQHVLSFDDLGHLHWLYHVPADIVPLNAYFQTVEALASADKTARNDLVVTLETYLDLGARPKQTARTLFIHRNTLFHRLDRIQTLCGVDLDDPLVRLNLLLALKIRRLRAAALNST
jgi:purine catabolism regulator